MQNSLVGAFAAAQKPFDLLSTNSRLALQGFRPAAAFARLPTLGRHLPTRQQGETSAMPNAVQSCCERYRLGAWPNRLRNAVAKLAGLL